VEHSSRANILKVLFFKNKYTNRNHKSKTTNAHHLWGVCFTLSRGCAFTHTRTHTQRERQRRRDDDEEKEEEEGLKRKQIKNGERVDAECKRER
jgi:hypothetical protein